MTVSEVKSVDDLKTKVKGARSAVVYLWGESSPLCATLSPQFETVSNSKNNVDFYKINVAVKDAKTLLNVVEIPAFILFENGEQSDKAVGNKANLQSLRGLVAKA